MLPFAPAPVKSEASTIAMTTADASPQATPPGGPPGEAPGTPSIALTLTGERTLPGIADEAYWFQRHVVAYRLAATRVRGGEVLDAGCGEGYGADLLARAGATRVVAVDNDPSVIAHIDERYPDVEPLRADLAALPLPDAAFDVVVSLQVIEHLPDVPRYLSELRRVLRPGGELVLTTPNRLTFTAEGAPLNPFHVREFSAEELRDELTAAGLRPGALLGIHHGPLLRALERGLRRPLTEVLTSGPPDTWPRAVRRTLRRTRPEWFRVRADDVDAALDLVALARRPRG